MRNLWYTGYVVSGVTFLGLAYLDWQIPGLVSAVLPVYVILLVTIVCGVMVLVSSSKTDSRPLLFSRRWLANALAIFFGLIAAVMIFKVGQVFAGYRLLLASIIAILPLILLSALRQVKT